MQIFVKHPSTGQSLVFSCSQTTQLADLIQWIEDRTGWPSKFYYLNLKGKLIDLKTEGQLFKTFDELGIQQEDTIHVVGKLIA